LSEAASAPFLGEVVAKSDLHSNSRKIVEELIAKKNASHLSNPAIRNGCYVSLKLLRCLGGSVLGVHRFADRDVSSQLLGPAQPVGFLTGSAWWGWAGLGMCSR